MTPQPGMRPQFPTPPINKHQAVGTMGAQGTQQQVPMQQVPQAVKMTGGMGQAQVFFDRSGLTQHQLLTQHAQHLQQPQLQHQLQTQNLMTQQSHGVTSQSQVGHHQMTQAQTHVNVPSVQVASSMPVQQPPVHPGIFDYSY